MRIALVVLVVAGLVPFGLALRAHRGTSLLHALLWALTAWVGWGIAFAVAGPPSADLEPFRYGALCLTGCAGVAVLGARRPHVFAWNFVVLGLLAVMLWPLIETRVLGTQTFDGLRILFMAGTITIGTLNYLPTRLGPAAFVLLLACAGEIVGMLAAGSFDIGDAILFDLQVTMVPWIGWGFLASRRTNRSPFDHLWLSFRDSWGLAWSQRVREQFNRAAENAGWSDRLSWQGLKEEKQTPALMPAAKDQREETLRALLQRFLESDQR